jgi:DNA-binding beta-propeller fold protein YncE
MQRFIPIILLCITIIACSSPQVVEERTDFMGVLVVVNKSGDDLYLINRQTGDILIKLETGVEPHEVEVSQDGKWAVVCNYGNRETPGNTLSVYDISTGQFVRTIDLGEHTRPHGMQWIGGTSHMLVTTEGSKHLLKVDIESGAILMEMFTGLDISHMVAVTPDFSRAFVSDIRSGNVSVFDLETSELVSEVYSGKGAEGIAVSPDGKELWVTNRSDNTLTVFDSESLEILATLSCEDFPIRAKFTPNGQYFLVSNARSGDVAVFDTQRRELKARVAMEPHVPEDQDAEKYFADFEGTSVPIGLVIPDNDFAYVANTRSNAITEISLTDFKITRQIPAGNEPDGIHFSTVQPRLNAE